MIERVRTLIARVPASAGMVFFFVACTLTYYGQLHRAQPGDTYGTIYAAVAIVQSGEVWLDDYLPYIQARSGEHPYMLTTGRDGHVVNGPPLGTSLLAVPVMAAFSAAGVDADDWDSWLEAAQLTAALTGGGAASLLFLLLTRLTTRGRAALITGAYAWGTLAWGISGQALWQHGSAGLALIVALLSFVDRRFLLAGAAVAAMIAFRPSTPAIALFLLPLVGRRLINWAAFLAGAAPVVGGLALYNYLVFGAPQTQGYGDAYVAEASRPQDTGSMLEAAGTLLASPGRGLFFYSPVLLFAIAGAALGMRKGLYRSCAVAFAVYVLAIGNLGQWSGNESFGPRKLVETLPLLAVLMVPALDRCLERRGWRVAFGALLVPSVFVQVVGAAMWPPDTWFGDHDIFDISIWWNLADNEIEAMLLDDPGVVPRIVAMVGLLMGAIGAGLLAQGAWSRKGLIVRGRIGATSGDGVS